MMRFFLTMIFFFCANSLFAQKLVIDSVAYKEWPSLESPTISKNGQYVFYNIINLPIGSKTLVVQSTNGKWKKEFSDRLKDGNQIFSDKYFIFINKNDSLGMLTLGTDQIKYVPNTSWCNLQGNKEGEYLWYPSGSNPKTLVLKNLKTNKQKSFDDVESWNFEDNMFILIKSVSGNDHKQSVNLVDIATGKLSKIWEGNKPENLILDVKHKQLAFKTGDSVWCYKTGFASAVCISNKIASSIEPGLSLGYLDSFSKDGKFLFTSLIGKKDTIKSKNEAVEIWNYTDIKLQAEQEKAIANQKYVAVINKEDHRIIRLQQQEGEWFYFPNSEDAISAVALVENPHVGAPWSTAYKLSWDLISVASGERKNLVFLDNVKAHLIRLSPKGKYIVFFDKTKQNYFSYEISTGTIRNLTKNLKVSWIDVDSDRPGSKPESARGVNSQIWFKNDESVLIYDSNDIWKLDPLAKEKPVNLTNGYGKRNDVIFNYVLGSFNGNTINKGEKLYLTAFNKKSKNNGFFFKQLDKVGDPDLLNMGSYLYQTNSPYVALDFTPIKAKNSETYIVRRMSAGEAPNYFSTKDFKIFTKLSDVQPQKKYNWYTTELHSWKSLDGRVLQGILYKPENFDPNEKYSIIFHYYERKSDLLNAYLRPESLQGGMNIDIPSYVSRGYLVFSPDIYYQVGDPMQGTYDAVVSAANYVSTLPFVNKKKMGLQGGSFGGVQTNYLVTHTNLFTAATSSAGLADWVSDYGSLGEPGVSVSDRQDIFYERGQTRIGGNLWEKPDAYIKNSPIFQVDKITTPLLIMHGKKDGACPFSNVLEFYLGLRRMGKKTWMLAYPEGNHGLTNKDEIGDFSIRMMQFFDHYLKDKPAPLWMLDGVAAKDRSWNAGLELDAKGRTPGPGLLTAEEQQKVDSLMTRKPITVTLK